MKMSGSRLNAKKINTTIFLNILSSFILQGINYFTVPLFSRLLGTAQYGKWSTYNAWLSVIVCVVGLGVGNTLGVGYYDFKGKYYQFRSSILLFSLTTGIALVGITTILCQPLSKWLGYAPILVILLAAEAVLYSVIGFANSSFLYEKRADLNFIMSLGVTIISVIGSYLLIVNAPQDEKYVARILGGVASHAIIGVSIVFLFFLSHPPTIHKEYIQYAVSIGFPIVFHTLSHSLLAQSDRIMMDKLGTPDYEIGIYSLFYSFSAVLNSILTALNNSWCPFYYDDLSENAFQRLKKKCHHYLELYTVLTCGFLLVSREVGMLFGGRDYWSGLNIVPVLVCAVYFIFMYQFPVNFEFYHKKTRVIAVGTVGAAGLNILLNYFMIPQWGMYGAALATCIAYLLLFVFHYIIVTHMKEHKFHLKLVEFAPGFLAVMLAAICYYMLQDMWGIRWFVGASIGIIELCRILKRKSIF